MSFKDGMLAITKVLKVLAVTSAAICIVASIADRTFIGIFVGIVLFLMLWTPAWVIKKFIQ